MIAKEYITIMISKLTAACPFVFEEMNMISEELANLVWPEDYVCQVFDEA